MKKNVLWLLLLLAMTRLCASGAWAVEQSASVPWVEACQHQYRTIVTPPTCTTRGRTLYLCEKCGNSYVGDYREPLAHEMTNWVSVEGYQGSVHSVCHRGGDLAPENTLAAFELAKKQGYTYVETDIQFTKDGVPVLLHDRTIDRTSNGSGNVADYTYEELKKLDFGSWKDENYTGTIIPTFEEFLQLAAQLHLKPYVELKAGMDAEKVPELVKQVQRYGMEQDVTFISFDVQLLEKVAQQLPGVRLGYLVLKMGAEQINTAKKLGQYGGTVFLDCYYGILTSDWIETLKEEQIPVEVWTVNDESWIAQMDPYISGITSDQCGVTQEKGGELVRYCRWCDHQETKIE